MNSNKQVEEAITVGDGLYKRLEEEGMDELGGSLLEGLMEILKSLVVAGNQEAGDRYEGQVAGPIYEGEVDGNIHTQSIYEGGRETSGTEHFPTAADMTIYEGEEEGTETRQFATDIYAGGAEVIGKEHFPTAAIYEGGAEVIGKEHFTTAAIYQGGAEGGEHSSVDRLCVDGLVNGQSGQAGVEA